jgi:virginiamycin B lyase
MAVALIAVGVMVNFILLTHAPSCVNSSTVAASIQKSQLQHVHFGAVLKYRLPAGRSPNGIAVAPDGSVWFGEQALPGVGHLYVNGTLVEYRWPFQYTSVLSSSYIGFTFIWGVAIWNGCVWASDQAGSQLVAVDPASGRIITVKVNVGSFPYTLTVGPDDSLWFTEIFASKIGRVDSQLHLHEYSLPVLGTPAQIVFANSSLGYYIDTGNIGLVEPAVYSFDPNNFSPIQIYSNGTTLLSPTSLTLAKDGLWVAQHTSSNLAHYDFENHAWSQYPTTPVSYVQTNLPYFVAANGSLVWFNEHYANRMAVIDSARGLLTEYSLSNPPANKTNQIDNALTFALGKDKVWFTELTANYVGYVDATYHPSFSFQPPTNSNLQLTAGRKTSTNLILEGTGNKTLKITSTDSEPLTLKPPQIALNLSETELGNLNGQATVTLSVASSQSTLPGDYTLLVSVTDGLVTQGIYLTLTVSQ